MKKHRSKKKRHQRQEEEPAIEQDGTFYFIAGYTDGGTPYGVTWEEMGLEPWQDIEKLEMAKGDVHAIPDDEDLPFT